MTITSNYVQPVRIMLVEDNPGDAILTEEAFHDSKLSVTMETFDTAEAALNNLRDPIYPYPDLILMDINLPAMTGLEALTIIKEDIKLKKIPVVVLTTSSADQDVLEAYDHHANCYITKPVKFEAFQEVMKSLEDFWFTIVKLPKG